MTFGDLLERCEDLKRRGVMVHTRVQVKAFVVVGPLGGGPQFVETAVRPLEAVDYNGSVVTLEGD